MGSVAKWALPASLLLTVSCTTLREPLPRVEIRPGLESVTVLHNGEPVEIRRLADPNHRITGEYSLTSRPCPPRCIHAFVAAPGVETIGELELIEYLRRIAAGDDSVLVIDSRTADWTARGTIPGSYSIPWRTLKPDTSDPLTVLGLLEDVFHVDTSDTLWDFSAARTLVLFCNGIWCNQSPQNINTLIRLGYPRDKLKWYRGGVESWLQLGLPLVEP